MSLFSHNKCGKITIKYWELDIFFYFTFYLFGGAYAPNAPPPAYGPVACSFHSVASWWRRKMFKLYYRLAVMAISQISAKLSPGISKTPLRVKIHIGGGEVPPVHTLPCTLPVRICLPVMFNSEKEHTDSPNLHKPSTSRPRPKFWHLALTPS